MIVWLLERHGWSKDDARMLLALTGDVPRPDADRAVHGAAGGGEGTLARSEPMTSPAEVLLRKHTRREFRLRMQAGELKACIVPVAAIEQHLEHLAMEHDWRSAVHVATAVAERLRPQVLVDGGLMGGFSEHHMRTAGLMDIMRGACLSVVDVMVVHV